MSPVKIAEPNRHKAQVLARTNKSLAFGFPTPSIACNDIPGTERERYDLDTYIHSRIYIYTYMDSIFVPIYLSIYLLTYQPTYLTHVQVLYLSTPSRRKTPLRRSSKRLVISTWYVQSDKHINI